MATTKKSPTKEAPEKKAPTPLFDMTKDGEVISVCAAQVEQHESLGWQKKGK